MMRYVLPAISACLLGVVSMGVAAQPDQVRWESANPQMRAFLGGTWVEIEAGEQDDLQAIAEKCSRDIVVREMWKTESFYASIFSQYPTLEDAKGQMTFVSSGDALVMVERFAMSTRFDKYDAVNVAQGSNSGEFVLQFVEADEDWDATNAKWDEAPSRGAMPTVWYGLVRIGQRSDASEVAMLGFPLTAAGPFDSTKTYIRCAPFNGEAAE